MKLVKVGALSLNQTALDIRGNEERIRNGIAEAKKQDIGILCAPELCISGYGCEDFFLSPELSRQAVESLRRIAKDTEGITVSVGLPFWTNHKAVWNTAALISNGEILGFVAKQNLAGDGIHYEPRWFSAWPRGKRISVSVGDKKVPFGDIYFEVNGIKLGFEICEDAWARNRPAEDLSLLGVDLILNPSASHFAFGKLEVRKDFVIEGSRKCNVVYLYSNLLGNESGRIIYDGGNLIASNGKLLMQGKRFSFHDHVLDSAVVDVDLGRRNQAALESAVPIVEPDDSEALVIAPTFQAKGFAPAPQKQEISVESWESSTEIKYEELTRSVALGLMDYLRRSSSHGYVISMSGGADSGLCATLVRYMVELGVNELGVDGFSNRLPHFKRIQGKKSVDDIMKELLNLAYQGTKNSSETTRTAAREVAKGISATFHEWEVDEPIAFYREAIEKAIDRKLDWERDDLALQNIQARGRATPIWLLTNVLGSLLITTSNRSEAAVGYATMDGDTCGGLAPIAGIDKWSIRKILNWMQEHGPVGLSAVKALSYITAQEPKAELRPLSDEQTDEGDLMPFDLLDAIERLAIRDKKYPHEVLALLKPEFGEKFDSEYLTSSVEKFFRLWCQNQWKRERYAPSFHLDDENLDPKTWCRFPILSSGFTAELAALRKKTSQDR